MNGQMELDSFIEGCTAAKIKPLIYSQSLTCYKTVCPYCHLDNPEDRGFQYSDEERRLPKNVCRSCRKKFDDVNLDIRKSKDYLEVERLGLNGAVYKDEKGVWHEWKDPYEKKAVVTE
jgi:transposase-like protein